MGSNQILTLLCALIQIFGFAFLILTGIFNPVVIMLMGFSAVVMCLHSWRPSSPYNYLYILSGFCGILLVFLAWVRVA